MARIKRIFEEKNGWSEWIAPRFRPDYRLVCCDCGLAHDLQFRVMKPTSYRKPGEWLGKRVSGLKILFRARRNKRSTTMIRKAQGKGHLQPRRKSK